jgi:hypothetical protein
MNVAQANPIEELNRDGFFPEDDRDLPDADTEIFIDGKDEGGHSDELGDRNVETATLLTQINLLYGRELKNIARDKASIAARLGLTIFLSTLIGVIFLDVGSMDKSEPQVSYILFLVATKLQLIESAC